MTPAITVSLAFFSFFFPCDSVIEDPATPSGLLWYKLPRGSSAREPARPLVSSPAGTSLQVAHLRDKPSGSRSAWQDAGSMIPKLWFSAETLVNFRQTQPQLPCALFG